MTRRKRNYACRRKIEPFRTTMIITGETKKMKRLMEQNERKKGKNCSVGFDVLHLLLTAKAFSSLSRAVSLSLSLFSVLFFNFYCCSRNVCDRISSLLWHIISFFSTFFLYIHSSLVVIFVCMCM